MNAGTIRGVPSFRLRLTVSASRFAFFFSLIYLIVLICRASGGRSRRPVPPPPIIGRWDMTVHGTGGDYPSWLDVQKSGYRTLVGYFVGGSGSVRPISRVRFSNDQLRFALPPQWEWRKDDLRFEANLKQDRLEGWTDDDASKRVQWTAQRAPLLKRASPPVWGVPMQLFNGKDLRGWKARGSQQKSDWRIQDGHLTNTPGGSDLVSELRFDDFQLYAEFRYPSESNSGIYLRGRYEVQIEDTHGTEPNPHGCSAIYGFIKPRVDATRPAGEWQSFLITLLGRTVTVVLNDESVIDRQEIPGITGGALDSNEGMPGPIMLQGDHGLVEFRKLTITPASVAR